MKEHGVDGRVLGNTAQVFIDMGKPFANPLCPVPEPSPSGGPDAAVPSSVCNDRCDVGSELDTCRTVTAAGLVICLPQTTLGACGAGQRQCLTETAPTHSMSCVLGRKVFLSVGGQQLIDRYGHVGFSPNRLAWEMWTMSSAGSDGEVFLTSHRGAHLSDYHGQARLAWKKQGWEKWQILDAGEGKVVLKSHSDRYLQKVGTAPKVLKSFGTTARFVVSATDS